VLDDCHAAQAWCPYFLNRIRYELVEPGNDPIALGPIGDAIRAMAAATVSASGLAIGDLVRPQRTECLLAINESGLAMLAGGG
jgi:hypothetical protein